jgi:hypothetical protein
MRVNYVVCALCKLGYCYRYCCRLCVYGYASPPKNTHNLDSLKKNVLGSLRGFPGECFYLVFVLSPPPYSQVTGSLLDRFLLFYLSLYRNASETLTLRFSFFIISIFCVCVFFCSRGKGKKGLSWNDVNHATKHRQRKMKG